MHPQPFYHSTIKNQLVEQSEVFFNLDRENEPCVMKLENRHYAMIISFSSEQVSAYITKILPSVLFQRDSFLLFVMEPDR